MMRIIITIILSLLCNTAHAGPSLNFSNIISGPSSGNSDGIGSGAIITVWGNDLGTEQGTSKIYVGGIEAVVYHWTIADGSLPACPSNLYTYHKMIEITFAVPSGVPSGETTISATVNGVTSNTLPFTVRNGNIYFIKSTGDDTTGDGSWGNPWLTLQAALSGDGRVSAGDIVYSVGVGSTSGINVGATGRLVGTAANPISLIAYPGTRVTLSGSGYPGFVIYNYNANDDSLAQEYINFSGITITCFEDASNNSATGIRAIKGMRVIGVEITGPTAYSGYNGAIGGNRQAAGGGKYLGVYIHNYGRDNGIPYAGNSGTSPPYSSETEKNTWDIYQHLYYLSNRFSAVNLPYEIAWNVLVDNPIWQGIHVYDEANTGGWSGPLEIHHNVVKNQRGGAIEIELPDSLTSPPQVNIYNNLIISSIGDVYNNRAFRIRVTTPIVHIYNNTVVGWNEGMQFWTNNTTFSNNILYDYKGVVFAGDEPDIHTNNLFFSTQGTAQPTWAPTETGNVTGDPLFTDLSTEDFSLRNSSPAINTGATFVDVNTDLIGRERPQGSAYDIGSFESVITNRAHCILTGQTPCLTNGATYATVH